MRGADGRQAMEGRRERREAGGEGGGTHAEDGAPLLAHLLLRVELVLLGLVQDADAHHAVLVHVRVPEPRRGELHDGRDVRVVSGEGERAGEVAALVVGVLGPLHDDLPLIDVVVHQSDREAVDRRLRSGNGGERGGEGRRGQGEGRREGVRVSKRANETTTDALLSWPRGSADAQTAGDTRAYLGELLELVHEQNLAEIGVAALRHGRR